MEGILVPLGLFAAITISVGLILWFRHRNRSEMQQTIRLALDKGQELSPEIIDRLGHPKAPKDKDLRLAIIWIAVALAFVLSGYFIPDPSGYAFGGMLATAAFPFAIGLGFLIMWLFTNRND